jgi:galactonate dehydratase
MKIEKITPFLVDRFLLVRVYTDEGIVGNGEAGLWAHHPMVYAAVQELSEYYVGKDPLRIEHHFQVVSRNTHFMGAVQSAAISAIDIALWDILAKSVNLPVYQLLGGKCRDKVKVFANVGGATIDECVQSAAKGVEQGYISLRMMGSWPGCEKLNATQEITQIVERVKHVREAIGYEIDLGIECHRNFMPEEAILLGNELAAYRMLYYEDPLAPESIEALEYVARHVHIPIATGERFYNIYQFKDLIDRKIVSLIRSDPSLAGGYTQCKKIAGMAEAAFISIFPHLMGSPVNIAAFVQFDASIPNYFLHENYIGSDAFNDIVDHPVERQGGYIIVPDRPGIGLEIQEDKLEKYPYRPIKINGAFGADGSVVH